ncbi:MAG: MotA/TolQ/ExbB proton channel family protein [Lacunisphaera sp.]
MAAPQPHAEIFSRHASARSFAIGLDNGVPYVEIGNAGRTQRSVAGAPLAAGSWHHLAVTADGQQLTIYVDGANYSALGAGVPALAESSVIGGNPASGTAFAGELDEMEIDRVARSASAIKLAAASQGGDGPGKVVIFGADEQPTSWLHFLKGGYVGVIVGSLTLDGWVVIGILAVMSAVSWFVMIRKGLLVSRVGKANELFLENWRHVAADLSVLDAGDADHARSLGGRSSGRAMHGSPLYRIYHIGVEEIRHRISGDPADNRAKVLTARSIQAIRAALDGGLVRETQKMNSNMVLLTIAISGGPFLGLLGTVVGVMITFAAVASAGEVNVNAIAPGIAAALLATVAGLGVAIPALFGYNYLLTQIKGASNDMHIFIDEFITKLAEFYSDEVVIEATPGDSSH